MAAKDIYHEAVKNALIKDSWEIISDPYKIKYKDAQLFADLSAEKPIAAEQNGRKIVVEIKSFISPSLMRDFELALGQYILYRNLINLTYWIIEIKFKTTTQRTYFSIGNFYFKKCCSTFIILKPFQIISIYLRIVIYHF